MIEIRLDSGLVPSSHWVMPAIAAMMRGEFAHRHHAFPLGDRHEQLAAAAVAEFAERLRGLVFLVRREVAGAQHEAGLALHRGQNLVELTLQAAALRRAIAQENAHIAGKAGAVTNRQIERRQIVAEFEALHRHVDGLAPFVAGKQQRGRQHIDKFFVVGRHFGFALVGEAFPHLAELHGRDRADGFGLCRRSRSACPRACASVLMNDGFSACRRPRVVAFGRGRFAQPRLGVLQQPARRKPAEFFEELRPEKRRRIGKAHAGAVDLGLMREALRDDEAGFFRRAAFAQQNRAGFLDAVDIRLRNHAAHLAVEIFQARDDDDRVGQPVGNLDEIAHRALKALFGVIEEAQVFDLIDAEHQRRAVDGPDERAERCDDFKRAVFAGVGIERAHGFMRDRRQLAAMQILAHALIDARIAALHDKAAPARC